MGKFSNFYTGAVFASLVLLTATVTVPALDFGASDAAKAGRSRAANTPQQSRFGSVPAPDTSSPDSAVPTDASPAPSSLAPASSSSSAPKTNPVLYTVSPARASGVSMLGGDDYPYKDPKKFPENAADPWKFYYRQCTSFVAWRMNQLNGTGSFTNTMKHDGKTGLWSDAGNWASNARYLGYRVDNSPKVNSIAYFSSGNVAFVAGVSRGMVTLEEYNWKDGEQRYIKSQVPVSAITSFIHVAE